MIYFKPDFANGSIGSAKGASSVTMVGNGGCVIEEVTPPQGNGILSITISPSITTTPALNSVFPIYWEEGTEIPDTYEFESGESLENSYSVTIEPTEGWTLVLGETTGTIGEPVTADFETAGNELSIGIFAFEGEGEPVGDTPSIETALVITGGK